MPEMEQPRVTVAWDVGASLGEGPAWIDGALWFVDIKRGNVHRHDPATGENSTIAVGGNPSFVLPTDDGALLIGNRATLQRIVGGELADAVATVDMPDHNRTNDATVDPAGRLWLGTMDDGETQPSGAVYRFDGERIVAAGGECTITNGPAISTDGRFLYHVDTLGGTIHRFEIEGRERLENGTLFAQIAPEDGHPDGVTLDSESCLWVGLWGGWGLRRYAPDGTLLGTVAIPCANVTKVAFGGPDLATAFVTTASVGLSDEARAHQPLAGALFTFAAPAPGNPLPRVKLSR